MAAWLSLLQRPPEPTQQLSPFQLRNQALTLQQLGGQLAIQKQVQQENALKIQAAQEDEADQKTIGQAVQSNIGPDGIVNWDKVLATAGPNIRFRNLQGLNNAKQAYLKGALELTEAQQRQLAMRNQALANANTSLLQLPEEQRMDAYGPQRQQLIQQGFIKPDDPNYPENPPSLNDAVLRSHLGQVGLLAAWDKDLQTQAATKATAAREQSQANLADKIAQQTDQARVQQKLQQSAIQHSALDPDDTEGHAQWLAGVQADPDLAPILGKFTNNDARTRQAIEDAALPINQRGSVLQRRQNAQIRAETMSRNNPAQLAYEATNPDNTPEEQQQYKNALNLLAQNKQGGANAIFQNMRNLEVEANRFRAIDQKQNAQWLDTVKYDSAIKAADAKGETTIKDPKTGRELSIDEAKSIANQLRQQATQTQAEADQILKMHQWGKYAQGPAAPSATPTSTPNATPSTPGKYKPGDRVTTKSGQVVTITGVDANGKYTYK